MSFETKLLAELCVDVSYGYTESASTEEVGPKFLRITDIQGGVINWQQVPFCPASDENIKKYGLEVGDIVVARTGNSTGENAQIFLPPPSSVFASYLIRFRPNHQLANPFFVGYQLRDERFKQYVLSIRSGSAQPGANAKQLGAFPVRLIDRKSQDGAVQLLRALDDRISLLRETNATLEAIAQAIFKSWFVDFDPVHANAHTRAQQSGNSHPQAVQQNPAPHTAEAIAQNLGLDAATAALFPDHFQDSDLGPIPVGWRVGMLSDATVQKKGSINPLSDPSILFEHYSLPAFDNGQYPVFELGEEIKSNKTQLPYEAVLLSKLNPHIPRVWLPVKHGENAVCSTEFLAYSPRGSFGKEWLYCLFSSEEFQQQLCQLVTGTSNSHQRVKPDHVLEKKIVLAPNDVLETFRKIASPIFEKVYENRQQAQTLTQLRDTLLPRLISGQLRLPDAEAQVEAAVGGA